MNWGLSPPQRAFFRAHNLLTSGNGTPVLKWGSTDAYREDAAGQAVFSWTIPDGIFDTYRPQGVQPHIVASCPRPCW